MRRACTIVARLACLSPTLTLILCPSPNLNSYPNLSARPGATPTPSRTPDPHPHLTLILPGLTSCMADSFVMFFCVIIMIMSLLFVVVEEMSSTEVLPYLSFGHALAPSHPPSHPLTPHSLRQIPRFSSVISCMGCFLLLSSFVPYSGITTLSAGRLGL